MAKKKEDNREELLNTLSDVINKDSAKRGEGKTSYILTDEEDDPSKITDWISTGSSLLDLAISNRPHGGLPVGRIVELNGLPSTGKSLISAHLIVETQKKGGIAVYIDTENSISTDFWKSFGVDFKYLNYIQCTTVEEIFENIEKAITTIRKIDKNIILTIIVDSVAAASTKVEAESEHGKDGFNTGKSIIISKAMRKMTTMLGRQKVLIVFTNQLRENLKAMAFGDKWVVPGGKAIPFHASVIVRMNTTGKLTNSDKQAIGTKCKAVVKKNRMGPPERSAEFVIYYDSGIADYSSWIDVLIKHDLIKGDKRAYKYQSTDGKEIVFSLNQFVALMNSDETLKEEIYLKICDKCIMKYKDPNSKIVEDVTIDDIDEEADETETADITEE